MNKDDHDLLIHVATCVEKIDKKQDKFDGKLDKHIERENLFVTKKFWLATTGILLSLLASILFGSYAFTYKVSSDCHDHSENFSLHCKEPIGDRANAVSKER